MLTVKLIAIISKLCPISHFSYLYIMGRMFHICFWNNLQMLNIVIYVNEIFLSQFYMLVCINICVYEYSFNFCLVAKEYFSKFFPEKE